MQLFLKFNMIKWSYFKLFHIFTLNMPLHQINMFMTKIILLFTIWLFNNIYFYFFLAASSSSLALRRASRTPTRRASERALRKVAYALTAFSSSVIGRAFSFGHNCLIGNIASFCWTTFAVSAGLNRKNCNLICIYYF